MKERETHTLVIVFNRFQPDRGLSYVEIVYDPDSMSTEEIYLTRKPRSARFDQVLENGEGEHNQWNSHRAARLFGHHLERKGL